MKNGEIYRGLLLGAEDTMNMSLSEVLRTARNGQITKLPNVYLRGSSIRFIALPDLLKNAPVLQKVAAMKLKMEQEQQPRQQQQGKSSVALGLRGNCSYQFVFPGMFSLGLRLCHYQVKSENVGIEFLGEL
jgi:small nuclear ribonucleoprotein D3